MTLFSEIGKNSKIHKNDKRPEIAKIILNKSKELEFTSFLFQKLGTSV
jgi:hypothetical protein